MLRFLTIGILALVCSLAAPALARDEVITGIPLPGGDTFSYLLTDQGQAPRYAVILMPGGKGVLNPRMDGGKVAMSASGNFLIRSRALFATGPFVSVSTDATSTPGRIMAIVADLEKRYGKTAVYVVGTSRSTEATMSLSKSLDGQVAGFIHTSSMNSISGFDTRALKSRHLIVTHAKDACRVTSPSNSAGTARNYDIPLITMEGGKSVGDDCEAFAHHGYNGIERETVDKIKEWIVAGK